MHGAEPAVFIYLLCGVYSLFLFFMIIFFNLYTVPLLVPVL